MADASKVTAQFWIDVGGTFTDCFLSTPAGELRRHKLPSTGKTPGRVGAGSAILDGAILEGAVSDCANRDRAPDGVTAQGAPDGGSRTIAIEDPARRRDPAGVWVGYRLRWFDARGQELASGEVAAFDAQEGRLTVSMASGAVASVDELIAEGQSYELDGGEEAPIAAIRYLLGLDRRAPIPPVEVRLGATRGTNALLTRQGARTALVTTRGFADILLIGAQNRPRLFDLDIVKPSPLPALVAEIDERVAADGTLLTAPSPEQVRAELERLQAEGAESIAICLLHATAAPEHERLVATLARELGFAEVSVSHEVASLAKLVSRGDTTALDAYLNPVLRGYVAKLRAALGHGRLRLLTSAGGLTTAERFTGKDSILSGPAGGVVGYARVAEAAGFGRAIGFDMGGTSTDVSRYDGRFELEFETQKAGVRVAAPMLAIETVAAGGGSVCRFDGVKLVVGPESAGADPGPAAYGRGGPLTVTDLNIFLGRIPAERFPIPLRLDAIAARLDALAAEVNAEGQRYDRVALAESLLRVANATMVKAVRSISVVKGFDPREHALVAFGGAGGQHACAIAAELEMPSVLAHPDAGLLSAFGIGMAQLERHASTSLNRALDRASLDAAQAIAARQARTLADELIADGAKAEAIAVEHQLDLRYQGVEATIGVRLPSEDAPADRGEAPAAADPVAAARDEFDAAHRRLFGYVERRRGLEIATVRSKAAAKAAAEAPRSERVAPRAATSRGQTTAWFGGRSLAAPMFDRADLRPGDRMTGPAIVLEGGSTLVIDPGWTGEILSQGEVLLTRAAEDATEPGPNAPANAPPPTSSLKPHAASLSSCPDPAQLEIFNNQLSGIAEQMGHTLRNTASSVNVKERLDFSCAIFTAAGSLVVNAPHIPVHLGAMGQTVRRVIADNPRLAPGDVFITNDPYAGGSHLPDITVVTPVHDATTGKLLFFTASRAHHAEIGGVTPGSMPPFSRNLAEEGVLIRNFSLYGEPAEAQSASAVRPGGTRAGGSGAGGAAREPRWDALNAILSAGAYPSRDVASNLADLAAQVAANEQGARELLALAERQSLGYVLDYMRHIQDAAERKTRRAIARLGDGQRSRRDQLDDGTPIEVTITIQGETARFDFTGTGPVSSGNLNANPAIVGSAVMYVLRCLLAEDIPLNEGVMAPVEIVLPEGLLRPPAHDDPAQCAAIVGGNVETSQRVVDVLLGALELAAASQGTMNNLLFGDATFGYYETICGGAGATPHAAGADAVHTHMTNTRLTDPETLERRYPVRLRSFRIRRGSGGAGEHRGGDGVEREIEFLRELEVSLLTQRRGPAAPFGLAGGGAGALGRNTLRRADGGVEQLAALAQFQARPGDRLIIETPGGGGWGAPQGPASES